MRMKNLSVALAAAALSLAAVGSASAGTASDSFDITLEVSSYCTVDTSNADINMIHDSANGPNGNGVSTLYVVCNKDLPFTIAVDSAAGGAIVLTDSATSKTVPATLQLSDNAVAYAPMTWGTVANGESFPNVGTGSNQAFTIDLAYGNGYQPAVGTYAATQFVSVDY